MRCAFFIRRSNILKRNKHALFSFGAPGPKTNAAALPNGFALIIRLNQAKNNSGADKGLCFPSVLTIISMISMMPFTLTSTATYNEASFYLGVTRLINWFLALSPVSQGLLATLFTYFVTALGAGLVFFFKSINQKALDLMMGFAAGVMIAASFWSLLAPAIELSTDLGGNAWLTSAVGFMLGGVFIIGSDLLLSRAALIQSNGTALKRSILLTSAVTLHNIPEGLAIGVAFGCAAIGVEGASVQTAIMLAIGIGLQNFPEGVCIAMPLRRDGATRLKSFLIGQASGVVEPIAGVLGVLFALTMRGALPLVLSFSAGAMIAVVCSELIPESFKDNKTLAAFGVLFGFAIMMVLDVALG